MADRHATRKDLARLGRRLDSRSRSRDSKLEKKIDRVSLSLIRTQADVADIKETIETKLATKDDFRQMFGVVQGIADELQITRQERITLPHTLVKHGKTLDDHSRPISALESRRFKT